MQTNKTDAADARAMVLKLQRLIRMDSSGLDALEQLQRTLQRMGVVLVPANVNEHPLSLARRTGAKSVLGAENVVPTATAAFKGGSRPVDQRGPLPVP